MMRTIMRRKEEEGGVPGRQRGSGRPPGSSVAALAVTPSRGLRGVASEGA